MHRAAGNISHPTEREFGPIAVRVFPFSGRGGEETAVESIPTRGALFPFGGIFLHAVGSSG